MRIKYRNVEDDHVALSIFFSRHSHYARKIRITAEMIVLGVLLIVVLLPAILLRDGTYAYVGGVFFVVFAFWVLSGRIRLVKCAAKKSFREGKNKGFLGIHELEIDDYGILEKSEYNESKIAWAGIERIGSTPDYTFIFIGANLAIPLPKARVIEGDYEAFVAELKSRFVTITAMASESPDKTKETIIVDHKPASCEDKRAGRHSGYGIASFVIALASMGLAFLAFMAVVIVGIIFEGDVGRDNPLFVTCVIGVLFSWCATFVGAGFGIAGLLTKNRKKPFAVIGLILNLLMLLSVVVLTVLT